MHTEVPAAVIQKKAEHSTEPATILRHLITL